MSGPERHRRANRLHPARKPRDGRTAQRELKRLTWIDRSGDGYPIVITQERPR